MRTVGPQTQVQIDAQVFSRAVRVSVYDESGVELPIPFDAIARIPRVQTDMDQMTWRMTLQIISTPETAGIVKLGRKIRAWDVYAPGEDLPLFAGFVAELKNGRYYSKGSARETFDLECVGELARKLDAHFTRYQWAPSSINPRSSAESTTPRVTGIVRKLKLNVTYTHNATAATTTGPATATTIPCPTAGFSAGNVVYVYKGHFIERTTIESIGAGVLNLKSDQALSDSSYFPTGSIVVKAAGVVPLAAPLYFGDKTLENWLTVYSDATPTVPMTKNTDWVACQEQKSGALVIRFLTSPGVSFNIDIYTIDRWVLLSRRDYYNGATRTVTAPYYYILDGVSGTGTAENINEQVRSTVRGDKTHTNSEIWVPDPVTFFASDAATSRWASVWIGGVEFRGKVASVDKSGSANHGRITFDAAFPLRNYLGAAAVLAGGEEAGNTSTLYHEILTSGQRFAFYTSAGQYLSGFLLVEPMGGYMIFAFKTPTVIFIMPGYNAVRDPATGDFTADTGNWQIEGTSDSWIAPMSSGMFDPTQNEAGNDVGTALSAILQDAGIAAGDITVQASGFTLAALTRAQVKASELVDQIRRDVLPPNYKLREAEDGTVLMGYVTQLSEPQITLRDVKGLTPKEKPQTLTRVIVKGKQNQINRAGQLVRISEGIANRHRLFDGFKTTYAEAASLETPVTGIVFSIPACEPGRWPNIGKVVVSHDSDMHAYVGGTPDEYAPITWLPIGLTPSDGAQVFNKREWGDMAPIALGAGGVPGAAWNLIVQFEYVPGGSGWADEVEVHLTEGAYWEAAFTDNTSLAPADGPDGAAGFGARWSRPIPSLSMSCRYVPTADLKRMMADYGKGLDRVLVIQADGLTSAQAREIGQSSLDWAIRGATLYECQAVYDPRVQKGDTVAVPLPDGTTPRLLVWGLSKEDRTMALTLADLSK